jgi:hypothetical protein
MVILEVTLVVFHNFDDVCEVKSVTDDKVLGDCSESTRPTSKKTHAAIYIRKNFLMKCSLDSLQMLFEVEARAAFSFNVDVYLAFGDDEKLILAGYALIGRKDKLL